MPEQLTTRGDVNWVALESITQALTILGVDANRLDLIKSVTIDSDAVTVVRYRTDIDGRTYTAGNNMATVTTVIAIKRGDDEVVIEHLDHAFQLDGTCAFVGCSVRRESMHGDSDA